MSWQARRMASSRAPHGEVGFLGQYKRCGSAGRRQTRPEAQLVLPIAVGEHREAEEGQPVGARLVEGIEDARLVVITRAPCEQFVGLVASVASEAGWSR